MNKRRYYPSFLADPSVVCDQKAIYFRDQAKLAGGEKAKALIHMAEQLEAMSLRFAADASPLPPPISHFPVYREMINSRAAAALLLPALTIEPKVHP